MADKYIYREADWKDLGGEDLRLRTALYNAYVSDHYNHSFGDFGADIPQTILDRGFTWIGFNKPAITGGNYREAVMWKRSWQVEGAPMKWVYFAIRSCCYTFKGQYDHSDYCKSQLDRAKT
jgi:hypothetical protein